MTTFRNFLKAAAGGVATIALCATAIAQSDDLIEGTVVDVDVTNRTGTLTVELADTGNRETYAVTPSTQLTVRDNPGSILSRTDDIDAINDLERGDFVKLDLLADADGRYSVRTLERDSMDEQRAGRTADTRVAAASEARSNRSAYGSDDDDAQRNRTDRSGSTADYDYDALPSTATAMPLFGVIGFFALIAGLSIRAIRSFIRQ